MDATVRSELLDRFRRGAAEVREALAGIAEAELDRSAEGGWTPRMIAHHLADSEMTSAVRLRRLLAEDGPLIQAYDEELFARRLHYGDRPIERSLAAMEAARASCAELLESLDEEEWARAGTHSESGPYGVETWLELCVAHGHGHAAQIRRARGTA